MARASQAGLRRAARRVGELVTARGAWLLLVAAGGCLVAPLAAQLPDAEAAFQRGDYRAARAAYERVLAADSSNVRALYQLAILDSWDGKLGRSLERFARLRRLAPRDDDITVAHARVLAWADRTAAAGALYDSVLARAPDGTDGLAGRAGAGAACGAGGRLAAPRGATAAVPAGLGVRGLVPEGGAGTTPRSAALGLRLRPGRCVAAGIGYSHAPFDETAALIARGLVVDALDWSVDISPSPRWSLSAGGGGAWLSDSNSRYSAVVAVLARVASGVQVGPFARVMGYHLSGARGYFAPNRFSVLEGRVTVDWRRARWGARVDGGAGSQQVSDTAAHQLEWHLGLTLTRGWGASNEIALVGLLTNSAVAIATSGGRTEGFRYRTLGLRFQQGL